MKQATERAMGFELRKCFFRIDLRLTAQLPVGCSSLFEPERRDYQSGARHGAATEKAHCQQDDSLFILQSRGNKTPVT